MRRSKRAKASKCYAYNGDSDWEESQGGDDDEYDEEVQPQPKKKKNNRWMKKKEAAEAETVVRCAERTDLEATLLVLLPLVTEKERAKAFDLMRGASTEYAPLNKARGETLAVDGPLSLVPLSVLAMILQWLPFKNRYSFVHCVHPALRSISTHCPEIVWRHVDVDLSWHPPIFPPGKNSLETSLKSLPPGCVRKLFVQTQTKKGASQQDKLRVYNILTMSAFSDIYSLHVYGAKQTAASFIALSKVPVVTKLKYVAFSCFPRAEAALASGIATFLSKATNLTKLHLKPEWQFEHSFRINPLMDAAGHLRGGIAIISDFSMENTFEWSPEIVSHENTLFTQLLRSLPALQRLSCKMNVSEPSLRDLEKFKREHDAAPNLVHLQLAISACSCQNCLNAGFETPEKQVNFLNKLFEIMPNLKSLTLNGVKAGPMASSLHSQPPSLAYDAFFDSVDWALLPSLDGLNLEGFFSGGFTRRGRRFAGLSPACSVTNKGRDPKRHLLCTPNAFTKFGFA